MLIIVIILIVVIVFGVGISIKLSLGKNSFSAEIGDASSDGYTDSMCGKCGGNSFAVRTFDLNPLGIIHRSVTETVCRSCGEVVFKTFNSFRDKQKEEDGESTIH